jgi:glucose/arabinose dehydrogenase
MLRRLRRLPALVGAIVLPVLLATLAVALALAQPQDEQPGPVLVRSIQTSAGTIDVVQLVKGLDHPWGMAFLPDGRLLVTERAGSLRVLDGHGNVSEALEGTPEVYAEGQGGLLDVALDPDFARNGLVWLSFAEPGNGGASTAVGHGRLGEDRIEDFEVVFSQKPKVESNKHFGGRIVFAPDGRLFLTLAERFMFAPAQDLGSHLGKIVRIERDGSVPRDNPFAARGGARHEIWSYGHRNVESAAFDPSTGDLWVAEMGPEGGDELNLVEPGRNYGWPLVSWGQHYDGRDIPDPPTQPRLTDAVLQWTPVISPSGMVFYTGDAFPEWYGSMLIGGLTAQALVRLELFDHEVLSEERIALYERIRDVEQGPDGLVYVLTDDVRGSVWRLEPHAARD